MPRKPAQSQSRVDAWMLDQLAKSAFFHRKLHDWKLIEIADQIDQVRGENLNWDHLDIVEAAWNKLIHRGIKPITVFAHPDVLRTVPGSVAYYRMLAMVSQKSMKRIGLDLDAHEVGKPITDEESALRIARHLNRIISVLVESDEHIDPREFDLWRGMAAGAQAQGSWQNNKGASAEESIRDMILRRLRERKILAEQDANPARIDLGDGRVLAFADEPDIAVYQQGVPQIALEVKGGIDPAGILERVGAALKSLQRTRIENPGSTTILILQDVSMTDRARADLNLSKGTVTHLFSLTALLEQDIERERLFQILGI